MNKTPQRLDGLAYDAQIRAVLFDYTYLDYELCAYARARFERQVIEA